MRIKVVRSGFGGSFLRVVLLLLSAAISTIGAASAQGSSQGPILIISSYSPEVSNIDNNISEFINEYKTLGGRHDVVIESMNCKGLSEVHEWKSRMADILLKHHKTHQPSLILILGQEAWSAYISQDKKVFDRSVPVLCGMTSINTIMLPDDKVVLEEWEPDSVDIANELESGNIVSGLFSVYDVDRNIKLIQKIYPMVENIAFVSDNSYDGVSIQAHVKKQMLAHPELGLILLDGHRNTFPSIIEAIKNLPRNTALLMGTWRLDMNDNYFVSTTLYEIINTNSEVPCFTLTSVGLDYGVIGGYIPQDGTTGKELAARAYKYADSNGSSADTPLIEYIPNEYVFDYTRLTQLKINQGVLPLPYELRNRVLFTERYKYPLIAIASMFALLLLGYLMVFYYFFRIKRLKEAAEESDRLKSAFLANMSHEIRTPLNAIVGFSTLLTEEENMSEDQKGHAEIIRTNSDLLLRLINDILDISRLETGRLNFNYGPCEIISLCNNVISTMQAIKKTDVKLVLDAPFTSFEMVTDAQRLQQVLINLISNAMKFTPEGTITLGIKEDTQNDMVVFSVTDTGCGIPLEKQKLVFERFEKLNEFVQGTGLGLAICKITINMLGGDIWVDENYTDGARFVFTHPRHHKI